MKVKDLKKKSSPRIEAQFFRTLGIQSYGEDNLYPQVFRDIVNASASGGECMSRMADFIEGNGFTDVPFSEYAVNRRGDTMDDIHAQICQDIAMYNGFAIHVNYNIYGKITEIHHIPFENCRLEEPDSYGYVAHIAIHTDWSGRKTRAGKLIRVNRENIDYIDVFNPIREVVLAQIEAAGGIEFYKGQVLWYSMAGRFEYPVGMGDKVVTEMSTDEGLANVKYRSVRSSFIPTMMVVSKKGQATTKNDIYGSGESVDFDNDSLHDALVQIQGDTNIGKILEVTIENDEEKPEIVRLDSTNFDKEFTVTDSSVTERIYSAFGQEPWYCIRIGKIGFSGDILSDAFEYYNSIVSRKQRAIERTISMIFKYWFEVANASGDFSVKPLKYVKNGPSDNN